MMLHLWRKWMAVLFVALLLGSATLAGCFGSSDSEPSADEAVPVTPTKAEPAPTPTEVLVAETEAAAASSQVVIAHPPPPAEGKAALTIWADARLVPALRALATTFEGEFGLKIVVAEKELAQMSDELAQAGPKGEGPDILVGSYGSVGQMVEDRLLLELPLDNRAAEFDSNAIQAFSFDGKLYGLPYSAETVALIYNPTIITKAPTTWSEVQELATQLQASGVARYGLILQNNEPAQVYPILTAFGGYLFGSDAEGNVDTENVGLDGSGSLAAGAWLDAMKQDGLLLTVDDADKMYRAFADGEAAIMVADAGLVGRLRAADAPYAVAVLPGELEEAQPLLAVRGFMVSAFCRDPELVQTFLAEFIATPDFMQAMFKADPRPFAYLPVLDTIQNDELFSFVPTAENTQVIPTSPFFPSVWAAWTDALTRILAQDEPSEPTLSDAANQIRAAIAGP